MTLDCGSLLPLSLPRLAEEEDRECPPLPEEPPTLAKARPPKRQQAAAVQGAAFLPRLAEESVSLPFHRVLTFRRLWRLMLQ